MIQLGQKGKDKVSGFEGIIIGKAEYLTGCNQYALTPQIDKDGKRQDTEWFDEGRIEITGTGILAEEVKAEKNGGPNRDAPRI